jgi:hypothetical protein
MGLSALAKSNSSTCLGMFAEDIFPGYTLFRNTFFWHCSLIAGLSTLFTTEPGEEAPLFPRLCGEKIHVLLPKSERCRFFPLEL